MPYDGSLATAGTAANSVLAQDPTGLRRLWRLWRRRQQDRHQAARWTERDLRDLGLTRGDVFRTLSGPFWRYAPDPRSRD